LSAERLQEEITLFWRDLATNPSIEADIRAAGLEPSALADIEQTSAITVRPASSGVDTTAALLIVAFTPTANRMLQDLWSNLLLPRIRRRWGDDAIGEQSRGQE